MGAWNANQRMTLGNMHGNGVRSAAWCFGREHGPEPVARYGPIAELPAGGAKVRDLYVLGDIHGLIGRQQASSA